VWPEEAESSRETPHGGGFVLLILGAIDVFDDPAGIFGAEKYFLHKM
jgi:hypothetical protein